MKGVKYPSANTMTTPVIPSTVVSGMQATFIPYGKKHQFKQLGVVVVHDAQTEISLNEFDCRHRGKRSRFGKYLRELHAKGVDVSALLPTVESPEKEELTLAMAKRLYDALVKRTLYERIPCHKCSIKPAKVPQNAETWDWNKPAAKHSKYYKMAARIFKENDTDTAIRIINTITGYA